MSQVTDLEEEASTFFIVDQCKIVDLVFSLVTSISISILVEYHFAGTRTVMIWTEGRVDLKKKHNSGRRQPRKSPQQL